MAWWWRRAPVPPVQVQVQALVAAAKAIEATRERLVPSYESWQAEAWAFYDDLGEFRYAIDWRAEMVSRVRLRVGRVAPDLDEPELLDDGPAVELLQELQRGAAGGEPQLMRSFATQLGVAGECWLTGEDAAAASSWRVRSSDEIRESRDNRTSNWEVLDDGASSTQDRWRPIAPNSLVARVWEPHPRKYHMADSPSRAARPTLRELDLVNRHIQAGYLSRLATAGMVKIPQEISFPVRPEFADDPDPFMREWIETARQAIATPGTAAAVIPIPLRAAGEWLDKIDFVDFTVKADEKILDKRDSAIRRLATQLDLPAEILLGMGDVNHWTSWQLEESGIKVHILPMVERICDALNVGYLYPRLEASGIPHDDLTMWYDASEITLRPDRSAQAEVAHARFAINDTAYLREIGLDESDMPSDDELTYQILKALATDPANALAALKALTGEEVEPVAAPTAPPPGAPQEGAQPQQGPPGTEGAPPPPPGEQPPAKQAASTAMLQQLGATVRTLQVAQQGTRHWLVKDLNGFRVMHPTECRELQVPCPYNGKVPAAVPGRSGTYELTLTDGTLRVGAQKQDSNARRWA